MCIRDRFLPGNIRRLRLLTFHLLESGIGIKSRQIAGTDRSVSVNVYPCSNIDIYRRLLNILKSYRNPIRNMRVGKRRRNSCIRRGFGDFNTCDGRIIKIGLQNLASPAVYKEVLAGKDDAFEKNNSVQSMIYKYDGTNKAYWHFSGLKWASSGGNPNNNQNDILGVWSNSSYHGYEASDHNVYQLYYRTSQGTWNDGGGRAAGMSVRCMQDTENR